MQQYADVVTDLHGNVVPRAIVSIFNLDGSLAALFAPNESTPIANPVVADNLGYFTFKAANGNYKRSVTASGITTAIPGEIVLTNGAAASGGTVPTTASGIANVSSGNIIAATVQAAINELDSEKIGAVQLAGPGGAGIVGNTPAGGIGAATVQGALNELDTKKASLVQLALGTGAGLVAWLQSGTGALVRWVLDKLRERITVSDFPLDHAGFQNALACAAGRRLIVNAAVTLNTTVIPANVELVIEKGGMITMAASQALTINGPFSAGLYQVFASAGVEFPAGSEVNAEWWGSGATAFQRAVDSGCLYSTLKSGQICVKLSTSQTWATCIDLTTRNNVRLKFAPSIDVLSTSTDYIFDCTSMAYSQWEGVQVHSSTARVGVYLNRGTTRPSAEYNVFKDVSVTLASNTAANGGTGTIAMYNSRSELATLINCQLQADCPTIIENKTRSYLLPVYETMQAFGTGWDSTTIITARDCSYVATGNYAPSQYFDNVVGVEQTNCYWRQLGVNNGSNVYAVISNNINRSKFTGDCETWPAFFHSLRVANFLDIDIAIGASTLTATGVINVDSVSTDIGGISNSKIKVQSISTAVTGSCAVYGSRGYAYTLITNNDIASNLQTIGSADNTLRLNGAIDGNIETSGARRIINNVREYVTIGAYITNGTSLAYTMPAGVGSVEITAAYRLFVGADQQSVTVMLSRYNGSAPVALMKSNASSGTANRIDYVLAGSVLTFSSSASAGSSFIGYLIRETFGDAS